VPVIYTPVRILVDGHYYGATHSTG
jgi:hypothetical protein